MTHQEQNEARLDAVAIVLSQHRNREQDYTDLVATADVERLQRIIATLTNMVVLEQEQVQRLLEALGEHTGIAAPDYAEMVLTGYRQHILNEMAGES
jgi:hypothetical protein